VTGSARIPILGAVVCATVLATVLFLAYRVAGAGSADATILDHAMAARTTWIGTLARVIGYSTLVLIPAALVASLAWGVAAGRYRQAAAAASVFAAAMLTAEVMKVALAHPRFHAVLGQHQIGADAFPSGHATAIASAALAAALVASPRWRPHVLVAGGAYALAVCCSALVLGWHYPSDVVGGVLLAGVFFCATIAALRLARRETAPVVSRLALRRE
jgi:membrane-associated phospholipid phosphatase